MKRLQSLVLLLNNEARTPRITGPSSAAVPSQTLFEPDYWYDPFKLLELYDRASKNANDERNTAVKIIQSWLDNEETETSEIGLDTVRERMAALCGLVTPEYFIAANTKKITRTTGECVVCSAMTGALFNCILYAEQREHLIFPARLKGTDAGQLARHTHKGKWTPQYNLPSVKHAETPITVPGEYAYRRFDILPRVDAAVLHRAVPRTILRGQTTGPLTKQEVTSETLTAAIEQVGAGTEGLIYRYFPHSPPLGMPDLEMHLAYLARPNDG